MADTHDTSDPHESASGMPPFGDEATGATGAPGADTGSGTGPGTGSARTPGIDVQAMLGQLQGMISKVAAASEPTLREVAAKAAELAAVAAERAGPLAHTIADKTEEVSHTVAGRASGFASSIRSANKGEAHAGPRDAPSADSMVVSDVPYVSDPAEESPRDGA